MTPSPGQSPAETIGLKRNGSRSPRALAAKRPLDEVFETGPPLALRLAANVPPLAFEEIVGDEGGRQLAHRLVADDLAAEPLLQAGERREAVERIGGKISRRRNEHDELAVERDARGQRVRQRLEIGIAV